MRVVLAGLFVYGGMMVAVALLSHAFNHVSPPSMGLGLGLLVLALVGIATVVFNSPLTGAPKSLSAEAQVKELEEKGLLVDTDFAAVRAFGVEEYEDEGLHFFLELAGGGGVLYLTGQHLYDYAFDDEDDEDAPLPRFPCTRFTARRHRETGDVVDLVCGGALLDVEGVAPPFQREDHQRGVVPEDGDILTGESFDALKTRLRCPPPSPPADDDRTWPPPPKRPA